MSFRCTRQALDGCEKLLKSHETTWSENLLHWKLRNLWKCSLRGVARKKISKEKCTNCAKCKKSMLGEIFPVDSWNSKWKEKKKMKTVSVRSSWKFSFAFYFRTWLLLIELLHLVRSRTPLMTACRSPSIGFSERSRPTPTANYERAKKRHFDLSLRSLAVGLDFGKSVRCVEAKLFVKNYFIRKFH